MFCFFDLESCKTAKCGAGKKCIQRNDQPKCVCAPNCKALKGQRNTDTKRTLRFIQKREKIENMKGVEGVMKKRKRNSKRLHVIDANEDVDFVNSANNSSKFGKSEKIILSDKVFNKIHGDNKKRTTLKENAKNEYVKGNYSSSVMNVGHRHRGKNNFKQQTDWSSMIRTGGYGYDVPFPTHQFSVKFTNLISLDHTIIVSILQDTDHGHYFRPVCGTDGRTYKTECKLKKRACRREISTLQVAYKGQCQSKCYCFACGSIKT